jgi:peroxiredoxin
MKTEIRRQKTDFVQNFIMSNLKIFHFAMVLTNVNFKAPDFQGLNQDGKEIKLADFAGKNLILYFYPKDSTPGCTAEACDLRDNHDMWLVKAMLL